MASDEQHDLLALAEIEEADEPKDTTGAESLGYKLRNPGA